MSSTLEHFSHPDHLLRIKEDDVIPVNAKCYICNKPVIGSLTYTCTRNDSDCQSFYLHKSCAELPAQINHPKHNKHHLALLPRPKNYVCDVCGHVTSFSYTCDCNFDVCVSCAFEPKVLHHQGHEEHVLTLIQREALFKCDACREEAKDTSYVCTTCQFWIHKRCAFSPFIISDPTFHHHPLHLVYSIPEMHRYFKRFCAICNKLVRVVYWLYYCHKCTYFVHMKCATSSDTASIINKIEADGIDDEPDLLQFPLVDEDSLFEVIITQCGKFEVDFQSEAKNSITMSTTSNCPQTIDEHWSHKYHPLEHLQFTITETDNDNNIDNDRKVLICDGCIQPITVSRPSYYACIQCGFFLHSFCANKLPQELPAGASLYHPQHSLSLQKDRFYSFVSCEVCGYNTNGFYYHCETCDIKIDLRCIFFPTRIKHKSHKNHTLVQRPFSNSVCSVSKIRITFGLEYACKTCSNFHINILSAFYPSRMKHRYDLHPSTLRYPPFFYEGVFYCEICEEQVNNQLWLYHCGECDHSFHCDCLCWYEGIKLGGTIELTISDQPHTFALVLRRSKRKDSPLYSCGNCGHSYKLQILFECDGCGFLICRKCAIEILGE